MNVKPTSENNEPNDESKIDWSTFAEDFGRLYYGTKIPPKLNKNMTPDELINALKKMGSSCISVGLSSSGTFPFCTQMPSAYAVFGEIRSGYDARARGNSMAVIDHPFLRGLRRNRISPRCPYRQFP